MDLLESAPRGTSRIFYLRLSLVLLSLAAFFASVALIPSHGLVRSSLQDGVPTYTQPAWAWPYMDGAGFGYTDLTRERTDLVLEGVVKRGAASSERWRISHHGAVEVWVDGKALLREAEGMPATVTEVTARWEGDFVHLRAVMHPTRREIQDARNYVFGIETEDRFGGWHLLPEERLFAGVDAADCSVLVGRWIHVRVASLWCLVGVALFSFCMGVRRAFRTSPECVGIAAAALIAAFIARAIVLGDRFESDSRLASLSSNGDNYVLFARQTLAGGLSAVRGAYFSPGNTWWIMGVTSALGPELWKLLWANLVLGSCSVAALSFAAARVLSVRVGALVGLMGSFYGPLVFFQTTAQITAVATAAMAFLVASLLWHFHRPAPGRALATGLYLGLAALARPSHMILAPVLFASFLLRRRWRDAVMLTVGTACLVLPQTAFNATSLDPALISANGPINFLLGNNTDATGDYSRTDAYFAAHDEARENGKSLMYATGQEILRDPVRAAQLFLRKCSLVVLQDETDGMISYPDQGLGASPSLRAVTASGWVGMGVLATLAALGVFGMLLGGRRRDPFGATVMACALAFGMGTAAVFVNARIRSPLIPLLIILAAIGLDACISRRLRGRRLWGSAGLAGAFMVGMMWIQSHLPGRAMLASLPGDAVPLHAAEVGGLELLGYRMETDEFVAGRHVYVTLYWRAPAKLAEDRTVHLTVRSAAGDERWALARSVVGEVGFPARGTSTWGAGDAYAESYYLRLRRNVTGDVHVYVSIKGEPGTIRLGEARPVSAPRPMTERVVD